MGAALGAFMTSNPPKVSKQAFVLALTLPKGARYKRDDYVTLLKLIYDILMKIRKDGLLAIESDIESPEKARCSRSTRSSSRITTWWCSSPTACA